VCDRNNDILYTDFNVETHQLIKSTYPTTYICQADDGYKYENYHGQQAGINNIYAFDENKQFSACLLNRTENYAQPDVYDEWIDFDFDKHSHIPDGFYIVERGAYGDDRTLIKFTLNLYSHNNIKYLLQDGEGKDPEGYDIYYTKLTFNHIKKVLVASKSIRNDHFKPIVEACFKLLDSKTAKMVVNCGIGELGQVVRKQKFTIPTMSHDYVMAYEHLAEQNKYHTSVSFDTLDNGDIDFYYLMMTKTTDNYHNGSWINFQIIEDSIIRLKMMVEQIIYKQPTELTTSQVNQQLPYEFINENGTTYLSVKKTRR
jgi:hypothetical protein